MQGQNNSDQSFQDPNENQGAEVSTAQASPSHSDPFELIIFYILKDLTANPANYDRNTILRHLFELCLNTQRAGNVLYIMEYILSNVAPFGNIEPEELQNIIAKPKFKKCLSIFLENYDSKSFGKLLEFMQQIIPQEELQNIIAEFRFKERLSIFFENNDFKSFGKLLEFMQESLPEAIKRRLICEILYVADENIFTIAVQRNRGDFANYIYDFLYDNRLALSRNMFHKQMLEILRGYKNPELFKKIMSHLFTEIESSHHISHISELDEILSSRTYLNQCFENDDLEIFKKIVELLNNQEIIKRNERFDPSYKINKLQQIFYFCISSGKSEFAILLIEQMMLNPNYSIDTAGKVRSSFFHASMQCNLKLIKLFLDKMDASDYAREFERGSNPFHAACIFANLEVAEFFLKKQPALIDKENSQGRSPLYLACLSKNIDFFRFLLSKGANINNENSSKLTPLHLACKEGSIEVVKFLLENGGDDCNKENSNQQTPLHLACMSGNLELVKLLVERGAEINKQDKDQVTPLHLACIFGNIKLVNFLVENGAVLDKENQFFRSSLYILCRKSGDTEVVRFLINCGVDFNRDDDLGPPEEQYSALHHACLSGKLELVKLLIEHGADLRKEGAISTCTPISLGIESGDIDLIKFLFEKGVDFKNEENQNTIMRVLRVACIFW